MSTPRLRYTDALLPTMAALLYIAMAYVGGFALLLHERWWSWPLGVIAAAHAMVIASYMIHECAHGAVFMDTRHNEWLGRALLWINGACYGDYEAIKHKHLRHHFDRADVIAIDYREILQRHLLLRKITVVLERIYIPAVDSLMHAIVIARPFIDAHYRSQRSRVIFSLIVRGALLIVLARYSMPAFVGYLFAHLLFEIVLRTMDMHQHTYKFIPALDRPRETALSETNMHFDKQYERHNTYSNPLGHNAIANWLVLNFGFHNAHHEKPSAPWYRLAAINRELGPLASAQRFRFGDVLRSYRHYRLQRIVNIDSKDGQNTENDGIGFIGVLGVSFLTPV